jgi:hypothetical protein
MALIECSLCGKKLLYAGKMHHCDGAAKSSDGGASALGAIGKRITEQLPCRDEARARGKNPAPSGVMATLAVPSEANSVAQQPRGEPAQTNSCQAAGSPNIKRGRPRIGEVRAKPWLDCDPPMSERTWRRRQKESKE